ncbi:MAG: antirestriction protein ArdA [Oscillospiraceae bacterium]|nr:antirestriction protein ArdA [Oscillospiraceae bacterium]
MRIYIVNSKKYFDEGEEVGAWFTLPATYEDVAEKIGLSAGSEAYEIFNYEFPIEVGWPGTIEEANRFSRLIWELEGTQIYLVATELLASKQFEGIEDLIRKQNVIHVWRGCFSLAEVARERVDAGQYGEISDELKRYLDYEAIGRNLSTSRNFIETSGGVCEIV